MSEYRSPDGSLLVELQENEVKMSHWIRNPRVTDVGSGEVLFDLMDSDYWRWDGNPLFNAPGSVDLELRCYPGSEPGFTVRIERVSRAYEVIEGELHEELRSAFDEKLSLKMKQ